MVARMFLSQALLPWRCWRSSIWFWVLVLSRRTGFQDVLWSPGAWWISIWSKMSCDVEHGVPTMSYGNLSRICANCILVYTVYYCWIELCLQKHREHKPRAAQSHLEYNSLENRITGDALPMQRTFGSNSWCLAQRLVISSCQFFFSCPAWTA